MKKSKIALMVLKRTGAIKMIYSFAMTFMIISIAIWIFEPKITSLGDSLWYCFSVMTTIGFGDEISVTAVGRILSVILSLYSIFIIAIIPGLITSYYIEVVKIKADSSMEKFLHDLKRLPELSEEELKVLSEKAKHFDENRKKLK